MKKEMHPADGWLNRFAFWCRPTKAELRKRRLEYQTLLEDMVCPDPDSRFGTYVLEK